MVQFPQRGLCPRLSRYLIMGTVLAALVLYARAEPEWLETYSNGCLTKQVVHPKRAIQDSQGRGHQMKRATLKPVRSTQDVTPTE